MIIENSGWGDQVAQHQNELKAQLTTILNNQREKEIEKLYTLTTKATFDTVEEIINDPVYNLNDNFWDDIKEPYCKEISLVLENCKEILKQGFNSSPEEDKDFLERFQAEVRDFSSEYIKKLFKDININLLRKFNKHFKSDDDGKSRNWVTLEEAAIKDVWGVAKAKTEDLFKSFRYIEIPTELELESNGDVTPGGEENDDLLNLKKHSSSIINRKGTMMYGRLLTEQDINRVKDKFAEDCEAALEDAIRKHNNNPTGQIPMWFYVIFAYFAYDDIFRMLANPIFFYPLMFVFSIVAMLYSMGLGPVMIPVVRSSFNMGMR